MDQTKARAAGDDFYRRLQLSLLLRTLLVLFLLGATVFISFTRTPSLLTKPLIALYILSGVTFLVIIVSVLMLRFLRRLTLFSFLQIIYEVFFVTALIWITTTEGIESIFTFLYLLTIIMGGILQYRRGAFLAAATGSLCYGALLAAMKSDLLPLLLPTGFHPEDVKLNELIYNYFINLAAMFGTAVLASYLTEKLRATGDELQETMRDRDALEALNDNIVRSMSSGVLTLNREGRITSINEVAAAAAGVSRELAEGKGFITLFPEASAALAAAGTGPERRRFEASWKNTQGEPRYYEFRVSPLLGARDVALGSLLIVDDVTDLRQMETQLRQTDRLAAVGRLAAGIAHEIRNPLASISGSIQMLAQELQLDAVNRRLMNIVIRETDRLNGLITDFLLYARPGPRVLEEIYLDRLIAELVTVARNRPDMPANVNWQTNLEPDLMVRIDPRMFEQILWNLVNNAVQVQPQGGVVEINARRQPENGGHGRIRLEVGDRGPGIPVELLEKIFDPFFTTREGGTGLGLSIVYRIAEGMGARVWAENRPEGGARFVLEIPERTGALEGETGGKGNGSG